MKLIVDIMLVVVIKIDEDHAVMEVEAFKTWVIEIELNIIVQSTT